MGAQAREPMTLTLDVLAAGVPYPEDVVPDRGTSKVNVEVGEAVFDTHQAVAMHFGLLQRLPGNGQRHLPVLVHPAELHHNARWCHY